MMEDEPNPNTLPSSQFSEPQIPEDGHKESETTVTSSLSGLCVNRAQAPAIHKIPSFTGIPELSRELAGKETPPSPGGN